MTAAKHLDPIVGVDMHLVQPPGPVPPVMLPVPYAGYLIDPADYSPGACTVFINGLPRARAGTPGMGCPPHVPPGGMFVKPPTNECEMYQGSSTVLFDGEAASAQGHQVLSCHDVGMPAPVRAWKSTPAKSLMMAASQVIPIPGAPVMIGGAPTISASASASSESEEDETVLESIEVVVFDAFELPLANEKFELHLANGDVEDGTLDDAGRATVRDLPPGYALLVLPDIDERPSDRYELAVVPIAVDGTRTLPPLPDGTDTTITVGEIGASMRTLCLRHSLVNWRAMFLDSSNDALRERRIDPAILLPNDEVHVRVPESPAARYTRSGLTLKTGSKHQVHVTDWPTPYLYSV